MREEKQNPHHLTTDSRTVNITLVNITFVKQEHSSSPFLFQDTTRLQ